MKKIIHILSSLFIIPTSSIMSVSCKPIISIASKSFTGFTNDLNIFFKKNETIKVYNLEYLEFINDSWEHNGFESSLSSNKIENNIVELNINNPTEAEFIQTLSEIYNPNVIDNFYDFTGMTIIVENIFLNSIVVNNENGFYNTKVESDLALTIKKGWKDQGKILASLTNSNALNKTETFYFINKIISGINFRLKVLEKQNEDDNWDYEIEGSLNDDQKKAFVNKLVFSAKTKLSLDLSNKITFEMDENSADEFLIIDNFKYKFI
ncbi:hypothetical protein [Spiroplasma cantharicola]|uniref:Lipoprotein n=1 Tax=Spiroplasma cantharicola TaxID=362837 RepID=A0A0M3SJA7_9MOLU|nr:hypothetical protein [Spiroplasma cantharicola]ALD66404.1 hypothetical protein SCANT_v1c04980 [Spiroplasma cantharicola]